MRDLVIGPTKLGARLGKHRATIHGYMKRKENPIPHSDGPLGPVFDMEEVEDWLMGVDPELKKFLEDCK